MEEKISRYLSVWNACDLKCIYCYNDLKKSEEIFLNSYQNCIKRIDNLAREKPHIVIIWWEPLIYPKILNLLIYIKYKKIKSVALITNWVKFADMKFTNMFYRINTVTFLKISINAHNEELEELISRKPWINLLKREKWIKNIVNLMKNDSSWDELLILASNTVITKYNYKYVWEIVEYIYNLWIKNIAISFVYNLRWFSKNNLKSVVKYSDIIEEINKIKLKDDINFRIDWLPYCLHEKIKIKGYSIREVKDYHDKTGQANKEDYKKQYKSKLKKCDNCKDYWKYCNWVFKFYLEMFWDSEFQ